MARLLVPGSVLVLLLVGLWAPAVNGAEEYEVTLESGKTFKLVRLDPNTLEVRDTDDKLLGTLTLTGEPDAHVEVYNRRGRLLATVASINPDALELLARRKRND